MNLDALFRDSFGHYDPANMILFLKTNLDRRREAPPIDYLDFVY